MTSGPGGRSGRSFPGTGTTPCTLCVVADLAALRVAIGPIFAVGLAAGVAPHQAGAGAGGAAEKGAGRENSMPSDRRPRLVSAPKHALHAVGRRPGGTVETLQHSGQHALRGAEDLRRAAQVPSRHAADISGVLRGVRRNGRGEVVEAYGAR